MKTDHEQAMAALQPELGWRLCMEHEILGALPPGSQVWHRNYRKWLPAKRSNKNGRDSLAYGRIYRTKARPDPSYRDLLKAYMRHVMDTEGTFCIPAGFSDTGFTADQVHALKEIKQEIESELPGFQKWQSPNNPKP